MKLELEQGSQEWLDKRKYSITASEMPIIIGISPYCTSHTLWRRKLGFIKEQSDNPGMRKGREEEPRIRDLLNRSLGYNFVPEVHVHDDLPWILASLDGIDTDKGVVCEIKYSNADDHAIAKKGLVPAKYYPQIQTQLFVTGYETCIYASFHKEELVTVEVTRNDEYIEKDILPNAAEFYDSLIKMIEPALSESDYHEIVDNTEFEVLANLWKEEKKKLKYHQDKEKYFKNKLVDFTDDSNCRGYGIKMTRVNRSGNIDWKALWEDLLDKHPDIKKDFDLEDYTKEQIGYWKITEEKQ